MDSEFLEDVALSDRIRLVCAADAVDCAVAFWGRGMRDPLFPRWGEQTVRIVCDIAMQGTTRAALIELGGTDNPRLTVRDGLHAKVFVSAKGAVVGSANASGRGVGKTAGAAGQLIEAGVFFPPGSAGWRDATAFFAAQFERTRRVTQADLDRAAVWSREPALPIDKEALSQLDLFTRLRDHPALFARTTIALTTDDMDDKVVRASVKAYNRAAAKDDRIEHDDVFLQIGRGEAEPMERQVLLFHREAGTRGSVTGYVAVRAIPDTRPNLAVGKEAWSKFCRALGQPGLKKTMTKDQWRSIGELMQADEWLFTAERFAEVLSDVSQ